MSGALNGIRRITPSKGTISLAHRALLSSFFIEYNLNLARIFVAHDPFFSSLFFLLLLAYSTIDPTITLYL